MGSHDIALDVVVGALAERGFTARTIAVGSQGGVAAAQRGQCDVAPVHLIDPATGVYNKHLLAPGLSLVKGWQRMQGVLFRPGDQRFEGKPRRGRGEGRARRSLLPDGQPQRRRRHPRADRQAARGARPPGYANQPRSHNAVAAAVAQARADWGVAIEPVARMYGLGFLPLAPEHYDFLLVESRRERPAVQAFLAALRDRRTQGPDQGVGYATGR